jgi:cold shock CspA family protein
MVGTIRNFDEHRLCGFIVDEKSADTFFFHAHNVRLDAMGQQLPLARNVGAVVEFRLEPTERGIAAMDVTAFEPFATEPVDLKSHFELSEVVRWTAHPKAGGVGFAQRAGGDWVRFRDRNISTLGIEQLRPGMFIWHQIGFKFHNGRMFHPSEPLQGPVDPKDVVRAVNISICLEAEQQPQKQVHPLLSDRLKDTQLKNIRVRRPTANQPHV